MTIQAYLPTKQYGDNPYYTFIQTLTAYDIIRVWSNRQGDVDNVWRLEWCKINLVCDANAGDRLVYLMTSGAPDSQESVLSAAITANQNKWVVLGVTDLASTKGSMTINADQYLAINDLNGWVFWGDQGHLKLSITGNKAGDQIALYARFRWMNPTLGMRRPFQFYNPKDICSIDGGC